MGCERSEMYVKEFSIMGSVAVLHIYIQIMVFFYLQWLAGYLNQLLFRN